ncbi:MAG: DUF1571 domain-containing protein [Planctomycetota bacterium]
MPVLRWARQQLPALEALEDYSANLVKRERVDGQLGGYEYLSIRIRQRPFSVYAKFSAPAVVKGQEVLFVEGENRGAVWVQRERLPRMVSVMPDSVVAMSGQRYPLTEIGLLNLVNRLIEVGDHDVRYGECNVNYLTGAKVNNRVCTVIQVEHPVPRREFTFHLARIYIDDELKLPIRFESYTWPPKPGGKPELLEEYTYLDLKLNNGFTDQDFSTSNPEYGFR